MTSPSNDTSPAGAPEDVMELARDRYWKWVGGEIGMLEAIADAIMLDRASRSADTDALVAALTWYEERARNCRKITSEGNDARHALDKDGGERARAALQQHEEKKL